MMYGDNAVVTCAAKIIWDGVTRPETNDSGKLVHSLKVAIPAGAPEAQELQAICSKALNEGRFKGRMPANGNWPLSQSDPTKFEGQLAGMIEFNCKTYNGAPQVFDANGAVLAPMVYGPMLYPGAMVRLVVHAYDFDNKQKGIALGLDGVQIVDITTPRLPVGGVDAAGAFGVAPGGYAPPPAPGAPPAGYAPPPAPGAPPAGYAPPPAPGAPPAGYAPPPAPGAPPAGVQPAYDFLNPGAVPPAPPAPPAGPVMTAAANGVTYEAYIAANWTKEQLIAAGLCLPF